MLSVVPVQSENVEALVLLLAEMDRYYGATDEVPVDERAEQVAAMLFRPHPPAQVLLAWDGDRLVGMASYSFLWPAAGVTRSLYLKELYVAQDSRKRGVGRLLMQHLYRVATEQQCSRVEWTADSDNPEALQFYATLGVAQCPTKQFYRIDLVGNGAPPGIEPT